MKFSPKAVASLLLLVGSTSPVLGASSEALLRKNRSLLDATAPTLSCNEDVTLELSGSSVGLTSGDVIESLSDDSGGDLLIQFGASQLTYTCDNINNAETVTLVVTDEAGNSASCNADVDTQDVGDPNAVCTPITASLDENGSATVSANNLGGGSTDNCDNSLSLTPASSSFGCQDVGSNSVTLTATDDAGNTDTCDSTVTIVDDALPTFFICRDSDDPFTVVLTGATPMATLTFDANLPIAQQQPPNQIELPPGGFPKPIIKPPIDESPAEEVSSGDGPPEESSVNPINNVFTGGISFSVEAKSPSDRLLQKDDEEEVDDDDVAAADDNCGVASYSPPSKTYTCVDVGTDTFSVVATDVNDNSATCQVAVTIRENEAPVAQCVTDTIMKTLNTATAMLSVGEVDNGSTDNCQIDDISLSKSSFTCADLGSNTVTMTVEDTSGNTDTCTVTVMVLDTTQPDVDCVDTTLSVGSDGTLTIVAADVLANSDPADDNCGVPTATTTPNTFSCSDVSTTTSVTVTAVDGSGNSDSCTSALTIVDAVPPTITSCPAQTVTLDSSGSAILNAALYTATDNCGSSVTTTISPTSVTCSEVGSSALSVAFVDASSNESTCSPVVTVVDNTVPTINCPASISVSVSGPGMLSVPLASVTANDNCGITDVSTANLMYDCDNTETSRSITVTATDPSGNTATCDTTVTIVSDPALDCEDECDLFCVILSILTCGIL